MPWCKRVQTLAFLPCVAQIVGEFIAAHAVALNALMPTLTPHPSLALPPAQIVDEFIAAHLGRKVPKAWVQAALKEHAEHLGASKGWALKPSGLALLEAAAPAAAAEGGAAAAVEAAAAAAGPTPGAVAAAAAAGGAAAAAVGGVEPTPAAAKQASGAAGIERFFKKVQAAAAWSCCVRVAMARC